MNRQRRLLPHVLPAFRKLCRAFEKTFRRMKENVSAFKGKDFGLLKKRFGLFLGDFPYLLSSMVGQSCFTFSSNDSRSRARFLTAVR